jgi:hypothetical protein
MALSKIARDRIRRKLLALCEDANALGDCISELAPTASHPHEALLLAARAYKIAVLAVGPGLWGYLFEEGGSDV